MSASEQIECSNEFLSKVDELFKNEFGAVKRHAQEVTVAIKKLKCSIIRSQVERVARLIGKGKFKKAINAFNENFKPLELHYLEEILRTTFNLDKNWKNFIGFVEELDSKLKIPAYTVLLDEIGFKDLHMSVELLLIQSNIKNLKGQQGCTELRKKIDPHVERLLENLTSEVDNGSALFANSLSEISPETAFKAIKNMFSHYTGDPTLLVQYSQNLNDMKTSCMVMAFIFKRLLQANELVSEAAMLLWTTVNDLLEQIDFGDLKCVYTRSIEEAKEKLSANRSGYLELLKKLVDDNDLILFEKMWTLKNFMPEFVPFYYSEDSAKNLISIVNRNIHHSLKHVLLDLIYQEMMKHGHLSTFQAFKLFNSIRKSNATCSKEDFLKENAPRCVRKLLWGKSRECRIVNKYFSEPLFAPYDGVVYTWVPCTHDNNQIWSVTVDESLVVFAQAENKLDSANHCGVYFKACVNSIGTRWMIKPVDDDYVKIFSSKDRFLTADNLIESTHFADNARVVHFRDEIDSDRQLWRLEFIPNALNK